MVTMPGMAKTSEHCPTVPGVMASILFSLLYAIIFKNTNTVDWFNYASSSSRESLKSIGYKCCEKTLRPAIPPTTWAAIQRLPPHHCSELGPLSRYHHHSIVNAPTVSNERPEVCTLADVREPAGGQRSSPRTGKRKLRLNSVSPSDVFTEHEILSKGWCVPWECDRQSSAPPTPHKLQINKRAKSQAFFEAEDTEVTGMSHVAF